MSNQSESKIPKNVTDVIDAASMETTPENTVDVDVQKKFKEETKNTFSELKTANEKLGQQISDLTQQMRLMGENSPKVTPEKNLADEVWWRIRKFQAAKKGIKLTEK